MEKLSNSDSHREGAERGALASSHTSPLQTFGSSHSPLHTSLSTPLLSTPLLLSSSQKNTTPLHTSGPSCGVLWFLCLEFLTSPTLCSRAYSSRSGIRIRVLQLALERTRIQLYSAVFSRITVVASLVFTRCYEDTAQYRMPALMLVYSARRLASLYERYSSTSSPRWAGES